MLVMASMVLRSSSTYMSLPMTRTLPRMDLPLSSSEAMEATEAYLGVKIFLTRGTLMFGSVVSGVIRAMASLVSMRRMLPFSMSPRFLESSTTSRA